ncbi:MAG: transglycosylase domain-containing protein [Sphingomonadaceae bacterium]
MRYFTDWVLTQLETLTDEAVEPLDVTTSLNPRHQAAAEAAAQAQQIGGTQVAILAMRTDGAVTAMVGGRDYATSIYNRAVTARRQPGSAFKIFPYLVALEEGMTPTTTVVDEPIRIGNWSPRNSNGRFLGAMTLRQAFALSVNTVAVQLGQRFGFDQVAGMARRFGITTPISRQPAMALGASEVTLLQLTAAYASIAAGGVEARPWAIQSITTADGRLLYNRAPEAPRVLVAPFVAAYMTDMMRAAVETGTGRAAQIGRPLAGKTGTTSSNKDGWFLGFTPDLVAGVWMGRDDARAVRGLAGGQAPARVFAAFMSRALVGVQPTDLSDQVDMPAYGTAEPDAEAYGLAPGSELFPGSGSAPDPGRLDPSLLPDAPAPPAPSPAPAAASAPGAAPAAPKPAPLTDAWLEEATRPASPAPRPAQPAP